MCGFFGVIDFDGNITDSDHQEIIRGAASISYRGPDDDAILIRPKSCIGFQRLSIIDLKAPSQPFINNNIIMVCNGEIYNYIDLKNFEQLAHDQMIFYQGFQLEHLMSWIDFYKLSFLF